MTTYRPLPECITIKESSIHGLGVFAKCEIETGVNLGITHILIPHSEEFFAQKYCRTPLGGFYNHSETPNCKLKTKLVYFISPHDHTRLVTTVLELFTLTKISKGEEVTYLFYGCH